MNSNMAKTTNKFNQKKVENIFKEEYKFVNDLFSILPLPTQVHNDETEEGEYEGQSKKPLLTHNKTSRATSVMDLQNRLDKLKKSKATYKEKLQKKNLKNRLKKKTKQDERNAKQKLLRAQKLEESPVKTETDDQESATQTKPVFNSEGKIVFSKINFKGLGNQKQKKTETNPKKLLEKVKKENEKVQQLEASGETDKALLIKEKSAWKSALAKSQGDKVKDDPILLKKSIKKIEQKKRSSKKKWDARKETVQKAIGEKQKKRMDNIDKRKKVKKLNKLKKAAKKGKIIPGF